MTEYQVASRIAERTRDAGGRALFVGGWVRDRLLGRDSNDIDLEVYGIAAQPLRALLETVAPVNTVGRELHGVQGRPGRRRAAADRIEERDRSPRLRRDRRP